MIKSNSFLTEPTMAEKPKKSDKTRTAPGQKNPDGTVQLTAAELRKISGGVPAQPNPPPSASPDNKTKKG
jgi:hypothetical protein